MKDTVIVALIGASGSGLTSVAKELDVLGYNVIQGYTTREPKCEGEWGYTFIDGELSNDNTHIISEQGNFYRDDMISYFSGYKSSDYYFITTNQIAEGRINICTVDPQGASQLKEFYADDNVSVITIYLQVDEQIRAERLVRRVSNGYCITPKDNPDVWSRIRPDRDIFRIVRSDYTINANSNISRVVDIIEEVVCGVSQYEEE